jgi:maltose phosphorylase
VKEGRLHFNPFIPDQWKSYSFRIEFRGHVIKVKVSKDKTETILESGGALEVVLDGKMILVK